MNGREVFRHAVTKMTRAARLALQRSGLSIEDVSWIIPHQANLRIISAVGDRLGVPIERFVVNIGTLREHVRRVRRARPGRGGP